MLASVRRVAAALAPVVTGTPVVVYGGDTGQERSDARVVPWRDVEVLVG